MNKYKLIKFVKMEKKNGNVNDHLRRIMEILANDNVQGYSPTRGEYINHPSEEERTKKKERTKSLIDEANHFLTIALIPHTEGVTKGAFVASGDTKVLMEFLAHAFSDNPMLGIQFNAAMLKEIRGHGINTKKFNDDEEGESSID